MKRIGNLFDKICSLENLELADKRARKNKTHSYGVLRHDKHQKSNLLKLHDSLINQTYKTSKYDIFKIYEPKERDIYRLPYYPDRIMHHAIMNVLEPIWVSLFTKNTYNCIKHRGIHCLLKHLKYDLNDSKDVTKYCLKIDIKKFYPSINHDILKGTIRKKIKDNRLLYLLDEIIDSAKGVPIGNYLSQFFANLYLAYFDHWIKEEKHVKYYYRYADDMVFLGKSKKELHILLKDIKIYLSKLKLTLKSNYQIFPIDTRGIDFVGYVCFHDHALLRKSIKRNMCRKAYKYKNKSKNKKEYDEALAPYWGWAKHCNSNHLMNCLEYENV